MVQGLGPAITANIMAFFFTGFTNVAGIRPGLGYYSADWQNLGCCE